MDTPNTTAADLKRAQAKLQAITQAATQAIEDLRIEAQLLFDCGTVPGGSWHDQQLANRYDELIATAARLEQATNL